MNNPSLIGQVRLHFMTVCDINEKCLKRWDKWPDSFFFLLSNELVSFDYNCPPESRTFLVHSDRVESTVPDIWLNWAMSSAMMSPIMSDLTSKVHSTYILTYLFVL